MFVTCGHRREVEGSEVHSAGCVVLVAWGVSLCCGWLQCGCNTGIWSVLNVETVECMTWVCMVIWSKNFIAAEHGKYGLSFM